MCGLVPWVAFEKGANRCHGERQKEPVRFSDVECALQ